MDLTLVDIEFMLLISNYGYAYLPVNLTYTNKGKVYKFVSNEAIMGITYVMPLPVYNKVLLELRLPNKNEYIAKFTINPN